MKKDRAIPKFKDEDSEREFWAKADTTRYFDFKHAEHVSFPNLKHSSQATNRKNNKEFFDLIIHYAKSLKTSKNKRLKTHFKDDQFLLMIYKNFHIERYSKEYYQSIIRHKNELGKGKTTHLLGLVIEYLKNISENQKQYQLELFRTYDLILRNSFYPIDSKGNIELDFYKDAFDTALEFKQFQWARNFITRFNDKLNQSYKKDIIAFSNALLSFELGRYNEANNYINEVNLTNFIYEIEARVLQIQLAHKLGNLDAMHYMIDRYKHYLSNKRKLSSIEKSAYVDFVREMESIERGTKRMDLPNLKRRISKSLNVFHK